MVPREHSQNPAGVPSSRSCRYAQASPWRANSMHLMFPAGGIPNDTGGVFPAPVLVMVASYSRFMASCILPTKTTGDLVSGMWMLLEQRFQAIPQHILWDHESGIGRARLTDQVLGFSGALGMGVKQAPPRDPETKGIVERHNRYLATSFFPGRSFRTLAQTLVVIHCLGT